MLINKWYTKFEEEKVEITSFDLNFFLGFFWHVHLAHKIDAKKYPAKLSPVSGAEIKPPATTTVWFFEFVSCRLRPKNM
jgi:hypothetical protein